jgi:hypothetical protein
MSWRESRFNDEHIGSVEISVSISTLIDTIDRNESEYQHLFIIRSDVVDGIAADEDLVEYSISELSKEYVLDQAFFDRFQD